MSELERTEARFDEPDDDGEERMPSMGMPDLFDEGGVVTAGLKAAAMTARRWSRGLP